MGLFRRTATLPPAQTPGDREQAAAREAIIGDVGARIREGRMTSERQQQVEELPGGREMVTEAVRRAAAAQWGS